SPPGEDGLPAKGADCRADSLATRVDFLQPPEDLRTAVHAKDVLQPAGKTVAGKDRVDGYGAGTDVDEPSAQKLSRDDRAAGGDMQEINRFIGADDGPADHLARLNRLSSAKNDGHRNLSAELSPLKTKPSPF